MSRVATAILLVTIGLGVGLWLGIHPGSRETVEENWQRAGDSIARIQTDLDIELGSGAQAPADDQRTNERMPAEESSPLASLTRLLADLWEATRVLWSSLVARVEALS